VELWFIDSYRKKVAKRMHLVQELSELRYQSNKQLIVVHMEIEQEKNRFRKPSHESIHSTMDFSESTCSLKSCTCSESLSTLA
jgi:hypothetical protein